MLTFTNKMAAEFRERLQRRGLPAGQVTCCTMHAFCMRVLVVWGGWQELGLTRQPTPLTDAKQTGIVLSRCIREARLDMRLSEACAWLQLPSTQYTSWQAVADYLRHGGVRRQPASAGGRGPPRQPSAADPGGSVAVAQGALSAPAGATPTGAVDGAEPPPLPELAELYRQCFLAARREEEKEEAKGSKGKKKAAAGAGAAAAGARSKPARKRKTQDVAGAAGAAAAAAAAGSDEAAAPPAKVQQKGLQQRGIYAAFGQAAPQQCRPSQQAAQSQDPASKAASSSRGYGLNNQQQQQQQGEQQALHLHEAQAPQQQVAQQQLQQQQVSQQQQADAHQLSAMSPDRKSVV